MEYLTKLCICMFLMTVTVHGVTAALLKVCTNDVACTGSGGDPNAVCSTVAGTDGNKNCICTGAFKNNAADDGCVAKGLLDVCASTADCVVVGGEQNAICSKNTSMGGDTNGNCICTGAFKNNSKNDGCVAKEITTIVCTPGAPGTALCKKADPNAVCPTGGTKCKCKDGYKGTDSCTEVLVATDTTCDPKNAGNATCHGVDPNAMCPAGTTKCACKTDFFLGSDKTCVQKITTIACTPDENTQETSKCQKVDENSECPAEGDKCACKAGYSGTDSCTKDAGSSATSVWMTTSLIASSLLMYLPRLIGG